MPAVFTIEKKQFLPVTLDEAWTFFSTPDNLAVLTPPYLKMVIGSRSGSSKAYAGQIITYRLTPLFGIPVSWVTEITVTIA